MAGITQDWEDVVIRKKAPTAAARKDEKAVNAARRAGAEIETVRKCAYYICFFVWIFVLMCVRVLSLFDMRLCWRFWLVAIFI